MARILDRLRKPKTDGPPEQPAPAEAPPPQPIVQLDVDIATNDPLLDYLQSATGAVDITRLTLDSPALEQMREAGVEVIAPLVSQGELIGVINLGSRRSEQEHTSDDHKLLDDLAAQAAPAVRVAQLVRQQQIEARQRERIEQELKVARLIQQTLLPHDVPHLAGWDVAAYYQPAREVGGDFYDFLYFDDGLDIGGEVNAQAEDELAAAYAEASKDGVKAVVLNFSGMEHMNSSGIGLLVTILIRAQRAKQKLLACGLNDHYQQIFALTRPNEAIGIYGSEADAVAAVG